MLQQNGDTTEQYDSTTDVTPETPTWTTCDTLDPALCRKRKPGTVKCRCGCHAVAQALDPETAERFMHALAENDDAALTQIIEGPVKRFAIMEVLSSLIGNIFDDDEDGEGDDKPADDDATPDGMATVISVIIRKGGEQFYV